jgi:voltage-dependent calcium channel
VKDVRSYKPQTVVLGNVTGVLNLIVFVFLVTFLTAIFAVQIYRGEFPPEDSSGNTIHVTFAALFNSFIGMYQVLSSENWTILMYNATQYEAESNAAWIGAAFFILWFILANFIVLNMFIAVIQENFDVTEDEKRVQQVKAFLQQKELGGSSHGNLSLSAIFKLGRMSGRHKDPLDYGPATTEMLLNDTVVRDFLDEQLEPLDDLPADATLVDDNRIGRVRPGPLSAVWGKLVGFVKNREPNPFYSRLKFSRAYEELDPRTMAREVVTATEQRRRAQRQYLQKYPRYNVSMFLFKPDNPIRKFCQRIVGPGRGSQRIEGVDPVKPIWYAFSAFIYAAIVAMVLLACVSTPLYQQEFFKKKNGGDFTTNRSLTDTLGDWFIWTDVGFAALFAIEAMIKVIADGFFWTPNAYFRGSWGFIDGIVLVTLWINVVTALFKDGPVSKAVGAFKALRALRLLNVSDSARDTFHSVIILGGWKVLSVRTYPSRIAR